MVFTHEQNHVLCGLQNWEFDDQGYMRKRIASINDVQIAESDRRISVERSGSRLSKILTIYARCMTSQILALLLVHCKAWSWTKHIAKMAHFVSGLTRDRFWAD